METPPAEPVLPLAAETPAPRTTTIRIAGVGGAGCRIVERLRLENLEGVRLSAINTDSQALAGTDAAGKFLLGEAVRHGLSAGGDPDMGRQAAEADRDRLVSLFSGDDLVFIVAGMGGGTGTGAAPVVAEAAVEAGALVISFAALPFTFEGGRRTRQAEDGVAALRRCCDAVLTLPNDLLLQEAADNAAVLAGFQRADEWIARGVKSVWAMLHRTGLVNIDYAGLRQAFFGRSGRTLFGLCAGEGADAASHALENLKVCPLLHVPDQAHKADHLLVNILGGPDMTLAQVNQIMTGVTGLFGREAHVVMGAVVDGAMAGRIEVCVIGTTDMGGRGSPRRHVARPAIPAQPKEGMPVQQTVNEASRPVGAAGGAAQAPAEGSSLPAAQDEFTFTGDRRGSFESTERNLFEGEDLDVPAFMRRGIKISFN